MSGPATALLRRRGRPPTPRGGTERAPLRGAGTPRRPEGPLQGVRRPLSLSELGTPFPDRIGRRKEEEEEKGRGRGRRRGGKQEGRAREGSGKGRGGRKGGREGGETSLPSPCCCRRWCRRTTGSRRRGVAGVEPPPGRSGTRARRSLSPVARRCVLVLEVDHSPRR